MGRPAAKARRGRPPGRVAVGAHRPDRRAVPGAARPRGDHRDAVATSATSPSAREGRLEPRFLFVANGGDPATVIRGNEEVLVGRLTDAEFAFASDLDRGIEAMAGELDRVSFLEGSGSIAEKTLRVRELVRALCDRLGLPDRRRRPPRPAPPSSRRPTWSRAWSASSPISRGTPAGCTRAGPDLMSRPQPRSRSITCPTASPAPCRPATPVRRFRSPTRPTRSRSRSLSDSSPPGVVIPTVCDARPPGWSRWHLTEAGGFG